MLQWSGGEQELMYCEIYKSALAWPRPKSWSESLTLTDWNDQTYPVHVDRCSEPLESGTEYRNKCHRKEEVPMYSILRDVFLHSLRELSGLFSKVWAKREKGNARDNLHLSPWWLWQDLVRWSGATSWLTRRLKRGKVEVRFDAGEEGQRRLRVKRQTIPLRDPSIGKCRELGTAPRSEPWEQRRAYERSSPSFSFRKLSRKDWEIDSKDTDDRHNHHDRPITRYERFVERFDVEMGCRGFSRMLFWHGREWWNILWWRKGIQGDSKCR